MQSEREMNDVELNGAELAEMSELGDALRGDLDRVADRPAHFWMRQQARVRQRVASRGTLLRWPLAAMAALAVLSFALLSIKSPVPVSPSVTQTADADDLLLQDIQHSLAHRAPEPLMPASILVQEMTTTPRNDEKREN